MLTFPKITEGMIHSANIFPTKIPEWKSNWFPSATPKTPLDPKHVDIVRAVDRYQLNWRFPGLVMPEHIPQLCMNDHWVERVTKTDNQIPSLRILCLRKLSIYNLAFGGTKDYPYVTDAQYNTAIGLESKLLKMFKMHIGVDSSYNFNDTHCALKFYYAYCVDLDPIPFTIEEGDLKYWKFSKSKSSLRKYPDIPSMIIQGITVNFTHHPSKKQAKHIILSEIINQLNRIYEETRYEVPLVKNLIRHITSMAPKGQKLSVHDYGKMDEESVKAIYNKLRLFFISGDSGLHLLLKTRHQERTYAP